MDGNDVTTNNIKSLENSLNYDNLYSQKVDCFGTKVPRNDDVHNDMNDGVGKVYKVDCFGRKRPRNDEGRDVLHSGTKLSCFDGVCDDMGDGVGKVYKVDCFGRKRPRNDEGRDVLHSGTKLSCFDGGRDELYFAAIASRNDKDGEFLGMSINQNTQDITGGLKDALDTLNKEQQMAVTHTGGPLLILAGAGSGKTRVITTKIAYMISALGVDPHSILALTFTKKAANEMKERAIKLNSAASFAQISTFHSFGAQFLRRNPTNILHLASNFTIYDDADSLALLTRAAIDSGNKNISALDKKGLKYYAHLISLCKDYGVSQNWLENYNAAQDSAEFNKIFNNSTLSKIIDDPIFFEVYKIYEAALRKSGNVDFGDLIMLPKILLENDPILLNRVHRHYKAILIDEYQDVNSAQVALIRKIIENSNIYLCVVGDDDQSIYGFRGSDVANILKFNKVFPGTTIIKLTTNYRSTQSILNLANKVIHNNIGRLGKDLKCASTKNDEKEPTLITSQSDRDESDACAALILKGVAEGRNFCDYAVLYRINAQSALFEQSFIKNHIPYKIEGSLKFYERQEVKDVLAYIALIANENDAVSFGRVINTPARHIGRATVEKIMAASDTFNYSVIDNIKITSVIKLTKKTLEEYIRFCNLIKNLRATLAVGETDNLYNQKVDYFGDEPDRYDDVHDDINDGTRKVYKVDCFGRERPRNDVLHFVTVASLNDEGRDVLHSGTKPSCFDGVRDDMSDGVSEVYKVDCFGTKVPRNDGVYFATVDPRDDSADSVNKNGAGGSLSEFITKVCKDSGLSDYYTKIDNEEGTNRMANIGELINTARDYDVSNEGLISWLDDMTLFMPNPSDSADIKGNTNCVTLITVHNTKGLEYPVVILTGLEQGIFPLYKNGVTDIEEERRLFYVAATRARKELFLSYCHTRLYYGRIQEQDESQFLFEADLSACDDGDLGGKWKVGAKVYHDDYGTGYITDYKKLGSEVVITVQFQNGRFMRFLPEYQRNKITIISE